ncbi:MAG: hypothetical protein EBU76_07475, partial [Gammaproteobacteria bacterium]|nr:hypothetical protein [Gammaproteobacteria bacterium]
MRVVLYSALGLGTVAVAGFVWLFFMGGIAISDRTMLWRMMREEGVEPPSASLISEQLRVPP